MNVTSPTAEGAEHDPQYDPFSFYDDPYPVYHSLRRSAPLYYIAHLDLWVLSRFEDIQSVTRDWEVFSSGHGVALDDEGDIYAPGGLIDLDPPSHDRLRAAMAPYFSPKSVQQLEAEVRSKARELLAPVLEVGQADLARDLARPLPASVVCSRIGFPAEDHSQLAGWFAQMIERVPGQAESPPGVWEANAAMRDYIRSAADECVRSPRDDLLSSLADAASSDRISWDELVGMSIFLFYAGILTTASLISNSFLNLLEYRDQRSQLSSDPSLIPAAVEELLRYDAPVQSVSRVTSKDVVLHDEKIPRGSRILTLYGSANRDDRRWIESEVLDIGRERKRHLAFGEGIHHCLGAPLARLEARVALEEVLAVLPDYELNGDVERLYTPHERGLEGLPVAFPPVVAA
jgi:cytochrome P450